MNESNDSNVLQDCGDNTELQKNPINEEFNSISKMQTQELILQKVRKSTSNEPFKYKINLPAALHDHISCTKLQPDLSQSDHGVFTLNLSESEAQLDEPDERNLMKEFFSVNQPLTGDLERDETFKNIILVQLDLIQHQQEQILKKERQLQNALQDCKTVCKRLEEREKEIDNLKEQLSNKQESKTFLEIQKDDALDNQLTFLNFLTDSSNLLTCTDANLSTTQILTSNCDSQNCNVTSKKSTRNQLLNKKQTNDDQEQATQCISDDQTNKQDARSSSSGRKTEEKKRKKPLQINADLKEEKKSSTVKKKPVIKKANDKQLSSNSSNKKSSGDKSLSRPNSADFKSSDHSEDSERLNESKVQSTMMPFKTIETDFPYEIVTNKNFLNSLDDEEDKDSNNPSNSQLAKSGQQQSNIEIPSWRLYPISCSYSLEGTECLHDDVFYRRHSKLELDEKRRKRWEHQRLRELKNNERLRSSRYGKQQIETSLNSSKPSLSSQSIAQNDNHSNDVDSFYPPPNILKFIEVSDHLPVVAFGAPIPELPAKNFELPWNSSTSSNSESIKKTNTLDTDTQVTNRK